MIDELEKRKYTVLRNFFDQKDVERMNRRMWALRNSGALILDTQCPSSFSIYGDIVQSEIQEQYRDKLSNAVGINVLPTYTYARIYSPKEILQWHRDRPACQVSITTTLSYDTFDDQPWDIWVEDLYCNDNNSFSYEEADENGEVYTGRGRKATLYPGDALVYLGCELAHWRQPFIGIQQTQAFIHYVDADGPYAHHKFDQRPSLGSSVYTKAEGRWLPNSETPDLLI